MSSHAAHYYIEIDGKKDGPHDLITLMRRIRAKKITRETRIYVGGADSPMQAGNIEDLKLFFSSPEAKPSSGPTATLTTMGCIASGWRFTLEHNIMTVYAGGLLLLSLMIAIGLTQALGVTLGLMTAWCIFFPLHQLYLVFVLRIYRRQPVSMEFVRASIAPTFGSFMAAALLLALMIEGGMFLLIVPGIAVASLYIFVPFLIVDRRYGMLEAMEASRLLVSKYGTGAIKFIAIFVALHLACLALIIPLPLTLPIFAAALSELYEEISAI